MAKIFWGLPGTPRVAKFPGAPISLVHVENITPLLQISSLKKKKLILVPLMSRVNIKLLARTFRVLQKLTPACYQWPLWPHFSLLSFFPVPLQASYLTHSHLLVSAHAGSFSQSVLPSPLVPIASFKTRLNATSSRKTSWIFPLGSELSFL